MSIRILAPFVVLLSLAAGCQQHNAPRERPAGASVDSLPESRRPTHVVLVWLKKPGDEVARRSLIDASHQLRTIPGVLDVRRGPVLPSTRPVVDATFDVGIVITFADEKALQDYATHPTHLKLVEEVLKPHTDHYKVYDFTAVK